MVAVDLDTPPWLPSGQEAERLRARIERLESSTTDRSVNDATRNLRTLLRKAPVDTIRVSNGILVRKGFVCLSESPAGGSDRRVPPKDERPPSTRLMGRKGIALRLMLIALFEAQTRTEPGHHVAANLRPLWHSAEGQIAWTDLVATDPEDALTGKTAMTREDKKRRHLSSGLTALARADLVRFPHRSDHRNIHREFELLLEDRQPRPDARYSVPNPKQQPKPSGLFLLPTELFTKGWVSVLSDAELAFLLMAMMMMFQPDQDGFALTAKFRLRHLGLGPETYEAHRLLEAFGLIRVTRQAGRSANGRVTSLGTGGKVALPDFIQFLPEGLKRDGYGTVADALDNMFCR